MNQSDEQKPTNTEDLSANGHFVQDNSSMRYLEAPEISLDGGLTIMARANTRTFAERVEEALTIEAFRAWLESKDGDELVGIAAYSRECPIHNFLHPRLAKEERKKPLEIHTTIAALHCGRGLSNEAVLPNWATSFVNRVDAAFEYRDGDSVTAEEALAILAEVEKELADTSEK